VSFNKQSLTATTATLVFLSSLLLAPNLLNGKADALSRPSSSRGAAGLWIDQGHGPCGLGRICADWFTTPGGVYVTTCCIPIAKAGTTDYSACNDFRSPHSADDPSPHIMGPEGPEGPPD